MRRKLLIIMTTILIFTTLINPTFAATSSTAIDDVAVRLVTDPDTSSPPTSSDPDGFGSPGADGRVWTDKSVTVNDKNFDVVLSALSQEYISTSSSGSGGASVAADVIFVLDMSASMNNNNRIQNMVNAANKAIDIIMNANSANRIGVYYFNTTADVLMSLASYISPNTGDANPDNRYISYSGSGNSISVVSGLTKTTINGTTSATTTTSASTNTATHTQYGLYTGINALITDMAGYTTKQYGQRLPYVLLFTDGEANRAYTNWYSDLTNSSVRGTEKSGTAAEGTEEIAALTALTAAKLKDELTQQYQTYNDDSDVETTWFNVGLGVSYGDNRASALLSPQSTKDATTGSGSRALTRTQAATYTTGTYSAYSKYGPTGTPGIVYADQYIYYASDSDITPLNQAFIDLGNLVEAATSVITSPITTIPGGDSATLVFTDVLGTGMELKSAPKLAGTAGALSGGKYVWAGKNTTAEYNTASRTLIWTIPANELPTVQFSSRTNPVSGSYSNPNIAPIALSYTVGLQSTDSLTQPFYSNAYSGGIAQTTAAYVPATDNPFYYNIVKDGLGGFVSSTPKGIVTSLVNPDTEILKTTAKASNNTSTAAYLTDNAWSSESFVTRFGNNGALIPVAKIEKTANPTSASPGSTVTFTIKVTNLTDSAITNAVVKDTVDTALRIDTINDSGVNSAGTITWTIASIAGNATKTVSFEAVIDDSAVDGTTYSNTAKLTSVNGSALVTAAESEPVQVTVEQVTLTLVSSVPSGKIYTGESITLTPNIAGGTWVFDSEYFSREGNTFTALKAGASTPVYSVGGQSASYEVTILQKLTLVSSVPSGKIYTGESITLTPNIAGGTWVFDSAHFSRVGNTFTALKAGASTPVYSVGGQSANYEVTISQPLTIVPSISNGTITTGGRITLTPNIPGGTWEYDSAYFTRVGDTFVALKPGESIITYTVGGETTSYVVKIGQSKLPQTGQDFSVVYFMLAGVALIGVVLVIIAGRKRVRSLK